MTHRDIYLLTGVTLKALFMSMIGLLTVTHAATLRLEEVNKPFEK